MFIYPKAAPFAALLLAAGLLVSGPSNAGTNPIIGKWHLTGGAVYPNHPAFVCGVTDLTFSATTLTTVVSGTPTSQPVTYIYSPKPPVTEYVIDAGGGHVTYNFTGADDIVLDTGQLCTFHRVG